LLGQVFEHEQLLKWALCGVV